jgi:hypothetical protein
MRVYSLSPEADPFQILNSPLEFYESHDKFIRENLWYPLADGKQLAIQEIWRPIELQVMRGEEYKNCTVPSDFPWFILGFVMSGRAVNALRDMLEPHGEILPLICKDGEYWYYFPTSICDALDLTHSQYERYESGEVMHIDRYVLKPQSITAPLFLLKGCVLQSHTLVTDQFVDRVKQAGLQGFRFELVWSDEAEAIASLEKKRADQAAEIAAHQAAMRKSWRERAMNAREKREFKDYSADAIRATGVDTNATPDVVMTRLQERIGVVQKEMAGGKKLRPDDLSNLAWKFAIIWGEQMIREFGWEWVVVKPEKLDVYILVNQDRSLALFAPHEMLTAFQVPTHDVKALLAFNLLKANDIPLQPPHSFCDLTNNIVRIVAA